MSETRTEEESTQRALAMLDGMADLWFAESGFEPLQWPEPIVRAIKQAHVEGLYAGRCSNVDKTDAELTRLQSANADLVKALEWIKTIADANYEQDHKLRTEGARTLKRISDRALDAITHHKGRVQ